ncbi:MAG: GNAT family N-acetyltransferase [Actinobacteria bacterium]|nr:GNAT family N-acetyltransferase [Actinomycetota bacterium]
MVGLHPLVTRPATEADVGTIAEICNAVGRALHGADDLTADEVRTWFSHPDLDMFVAERAGRPVGYLDVRRTENGKFPLDVRVHPEAWGTGIADSLLAAGESWARERAQPVDVLRGYAAERNHDLRTALERAGFRVIRASFDMAIELAEEQPQPDWPTGIALRPYQPGQDDAAVYEADMDAFADNWDFHRTAYEEWRRWHLEVPTFDPSLFFLADAGGELAGISLCYRHRSGDPTWGWVGTLGVRPQFRRRGLGLALLRHSFGVFHRRGLRHAGLGVDAENTTGAVGLYERAGMHVARRDDTFEKAL